MDDYKYIRLAYKEAIKAYQKNEVPVGCVIVRDDIVLSKAHNMREAKKSAVSYVGNDYK